MLLQTDGNPNFLKYIFNNKNLYWTFIKKNTTELLKQLSEDEQQKVKNNNKAML